MIKKNYKEELRTEELPTHAFEFPPNKSVRRLYLRILETRATISIKVGLIFIYEMSCPVLISVDL